MELFNSSHNLAKQVVIILEGDRVDIQQQCVHAPKYDVVTPYFFVKDGKGKFYGPLVQEDVTSRPARLLKWNYAKWEGAPETGRHEYEYAYDEDEFW